MEVSVLGEDESVWVIERDIREQCGYDECVPLQRGGFGTTGVCTSSAWSVGERFGGFSTSMV